eukprot:scaffold35646_cov59-Attheya_sp.AAC.2
MHTIVFFFSKKSDSLDNDVLKFQLPPPRGFCKRCCRATSNEQRENRTMNNRSASSRSQHSRFKQQQRGKVTSSSNSSNDVK